MMAHIVTANDDASTRTKNRIREGGGVFYVGREMPYICLAGNTRTRARLLYSPKTTLVGWVPASEVTIN